MDCMMLKHESCTRFRDANFGFNLACVDVRMTCYSGKNYNLSSFICASSKTRSGTLIAPPREQPITCQPPAPELCRVRQPDTHEPTDTKCQFAHEGDERSAEPRLPASFCSFFGPRIAGAIRVILSRGTRVPSPLRAGLSELARINPVVLRLSYIQRRPYNLIHGKSMAKFNTRSCRSLARDRLYASSTSKSAISECEGVRTEQNDRSPGNGLSYRDISARTGHAATTVMRVWNQWIEESHTQRQADLWQPCESMNDGYHCFPGLHVRLTCRQSNTSAIRLVGNRQLVPHGPPSTTDDALWTRIQTVGMEIPQVLFDSMPRRVVVGVVDISLDSYHGESDSIPGGANPGFLHARSQIIYCHNFEWGANIVFLEVTLSPGLGPFLKVQMEKESERKEDKCDKGLEALSGVCGQPVRRCEGFLLGKMLYWECFEIHEDSSPFLLEPVHELSNGFWPHLTSPHPAIQFVLKMFYTVEVGALGRSVQSANIVMGARPFSYQSSLFALPLRGDLLRQYWSVQIDCRATGIKTGYKLFTRAFCWLSSSTLVVNSNCIVNGEDKRRGKKEVVTDKLRHDTRDSPALAPEQTGANLAAPPALKSPTVFSLVLVAPTTLLRKCVRQAFSQLGVFERGRTVVGLRDAGWMSRRTARHLDRSAYTVSRCWTQESTHTRREGSGGRPLLITRREDSSIVRQASSTHQAFLRNHPWTRRGSWMHAGVHEYHIQARRITILSECRRLQDLSLETFRPAPNCGAEHRPSERCQGTGCHFLQFTHPIRGDGMNPDGTAIRPRNSVAMSTTLPGAVRQPHSRACRC
ncbi:hypothetical protein PR048_025717 [Dryococelus australis]|uniref:Uncharacterized protein n=1 Tax=Dryococelus australis TaxID=614101 RepID=A0ABQ9GJA5_9NEOP|nr:hypothetical protein PR048_025717 [Dryococelus australis]